MPADKIMILDLETQNNPYFGAVASPRHPENYVVMKGWAIDKLPYDGEIQGAHYHSKEEAAQWLDIPDDVWLLVAHNAPYEMDWMLAQQREKFLAFLKRGGRIFDTALAHYLLSSQKDTYPSLDEIAPMYGGTPKVDGVKLLWEQGHLTADIDPALLAEYLLGPGGDIANTRKVFYGVVQKLQERGMWQMMLDRMEGQVALSFMMDAGLKVDRQRAFEDRDRIATDVDVLSADFVKDRGFLPEAATFKETSKHHMSAWVYGGPLKYRAKVPAKDADGNLKYAKVSCYAFTLADSATPTYVPVEAVTNADAFSRCVQVYGNPTRYKAGKNKGQPKPFPVESTEPQMVWGELTVQMPGIVQWGSYPSDFREEFIKENSGKLTLADGSPVISVSADAIKTLVDRVDTSGATREQLTSILQFFALRKDLSTYYLMEEVDDEGVVVKQSGALQYLTEADIIHHQLNTTSTATTRLSSNKPNFQNLPRGDENKLHTSKVKSMFVSRFGKDGYIVGPDYTALEVVGLASFSQDMALCEALLKGTDMHCLRLAAQTGETYEVVYDKCHNEDHPEHAKYKEMRTNIKPPSFAYQYGATARGISYATGMPVDQAEAFIEREKKLFPEVEEFYERKVYPVVEASVEQHREQGPEGWRLFGVGHWISPAGTSYEFRQYPKTVWAGGQRITAMEFKPTQMRNYPIQGESSFWVQVICGKLMRWLVANDFFDGKVCMINTVHDAVYFDVHKDVMALVCPQIKTIMESIPAALAHYPGYTFPVPFPVAVEYGVNMQDFKPFDIKDFQ